MSSLEAKLDDLRRTISSANGGIFPHAVLSTQQISLLNIHKPTTIAEVSFGSTCFYLLLQVYLQHRTFWFFFVQLEKLIGKVKTDKYGNDIIEVMRSEAEGGQDSGASGAKRQRKDKDVVSIESSEEEA
jgi:ATP-dependent DNA helicase Q1